MAERNVESFGAEVIMEFLRKSYFAVDELWFMRLENEHSYNEALRLDRQVWDIMPRIQARKAKALLGIDGCSLADLSRALQLKFAAEGCHCRVSGTSPDAVTVETPTCPWLAVIDKAGQGVFAKDICERICARALATWAEEFSPNIRFQFLSKLSDGDSACRMVFTKSVGDAELPVTVNEG